ncbi:conserved membrane hypothetical protein [Candidatus Terasakiella magnetica]|nr:conserved membrane hypothetical protein [Candidatus Terasakiella magnetica]
MLRFDIAPVCSNAYRFQAAMSFGIAALYLFTPYRWVALVLAFGGILRGFVSPHKCLSYRLFSAITAKLGWTQTVNAGAKMFADKIAGIAGIAMVASWLLGSDVGNIPATAILIFALIDLTTGFCAACWVYGVWYKFREA